MNEWELKQIYFQLKMPLIKVKYLATTLELVVLPEVRAYILSKASLI